MHYSLEGKWCMYLIADIFTHQLILILGKMVTSMFKMMSL